MQYTYNPFGKRDPFRSFVLDRSQEKNESSDPLLNYDLSKFTLTGVVWGISIPKAIVKDGDGRGHIISRGTRIGRNKGQVVRILKDEIVVAEEFRDPLGKLIVSEYSMRLEKEKENRKK
jgi:type IV pilus assembly protein PilP